MRVDFKAFQTCMGKVHCAGGLNKRRSCAHRSQSSTWTVRLRGRCVGARIFNHDRQTVFRSAIAQARGHLELEEPLTVAEHRGPHVSFPDSSSRPSTAARATPPRTCHLTTKPSWHCSSPIR